MIFVYKGILSPIKIGNLELKNRIVFAPTSMGLNMEEYFCRIRELAKGGVSLIIIGDIPVKESVLKSLYTEEGFKFFSKVCSIAHEYDSKVSAQLYLDEMSVNVIRESAMDYFNKTKSLSAMMNFMFPMIKECLKDLPIGEIEDMINEFNEFCIGSSMAMIGNTVFGFTKDTDSISKEYSIANIDNNGIRIEK